MGIAALVLGIVSILIGMVPFCGAIGFIPAIIGLVLGIVDLVKKNKSGEKQGIAIAGTALSGIAIVFILLWLFVYSATVGKAVKNELRNYNYNLNYSYNLTD